MSKGWVYFIALVILIITHTAAFNYGGKTESNARDAAEKILIVNKIEEGKAKAKENYDLELDAAKKEFERNLNERKRDVKIVKEIRDNPIYINSECNLPADGMRIWNDEARGYVLEPAAGETDGKVSGGITGKD